jgi:hypothetical protein
MDYNYQIRLRRGTSTQWELSDPILLDGEPGYDTTLNYYKIGDGVRRWSELPWTTGLKGDPATVDAGSTTTVDYNSTAQVTNVGTTQNAIFDFEIPEGKPGKDLFIHEGSAQNPPVDWLPRELLWDPDAEPPVGDVSQAYVDSGDAANSAETQAVAEELALVEDALRDVKVWAGDPTPLHVNSTLSEWLSDLADEVHHLSARPAFALDGILHVDMYNGFARVFSNTPELEIGGEKWVEFELATTPAPGGTIPPGANAIASSAGTLVRAGGTQGPVIGDTGGAVSQMALANYISQNRICRVLYNLSNPVRPTLTILETLDAIPTGNSALHLGALYDVSAPANTPAGKVLGTVAEGSWGPVDPPSGGGTPPLIVLGPTDPVPGGTAAGTVIVRKEA